MGDGIGAELRDVAGSDENVAGHGESH